MKQDTKYFTECPICSSSDIKSKYKFDDFWIMQCKLCHNSWRTNMYNKAKIEEIYCREEYAKDPYFQYKQEQLENLSLKRFKHYDRALDRVESMVEIGKIVDVGCGSGAFLAIAKKRGWEIHGIEISSHLAKACERNVGISVINSSFEEAELPNNYYDVLTFWDLIEHAIDPIYCINKARSLLRSGGIAIFCTPNEHSILTKLGCILYKLHYSYPALNLHPVEHTYFFTKDSFINLLKNQKLTVEHYYSQEAYFWHDPDANIIHKIGIALIEKIGTLFDSCYEMVVFAKS